MRFFAFPSKKNEAILAAALLSILVLIPFYQLALMEGVIITDDIFTSDIMNDGFPSRFYIGEALKSGHVPLWIPHVYGGFPLLARAEAGVCYPFNLLLFGILPPPAALNIVILITLVIAGISMYYYVREIGGNFIAGCLSGFSFMFSGYMLSHLKHLSNVNAACWLPLGLFLIERAIQRNEIKYFLWLGLVFGLQHLSGHTQIAYYCGLTYITYFIFRSFQQKKNSSSPSPFFGYRLTWYFLGAFVFGSGLAAVQLIPTYELVSLSQRSGGVAFDYAANYAYDPKNLLMFFYPYINGDIGNATYTGSSIFWEDYGYVGITILSMSLYASVRLWKHWYVKCFSIFTAVSLLLVLGPNTPIYEAVFYVVPGMNYFRFPTRFLLITDFSLIVLASIGFSHLSTQIKQGMVGDRKRKNVSHHQKFFPFSKFEFVVSVFVVIDLWYFQLRHNPIVHADPWLIPPKTVNLLKADTSLFRVYVVGGTESHKLAFARARGWQGSLQPYIEQREFIQPSTNVFYGLSAPDGYANLTPNYLVEIWGDQNRPGLVFQTADVRENTFYPKSSFGKLMNMYNVKYILSLWEIAQCEQLKSLGRIGEVYVYENRAVMPRAYFVGRSKIVRGIEEGKRVLLSDGFDPRQEVILYDGKPTLQHADSVRGNVYLKRYTPNSVEFQTDADAAALLVFSDSYYPGWTAEIDGKESKIFQANITQRAVAVPAGTHFVKFIFQSNTIEAGLWVTAVSAVCFMSFFVIVYRKQSH